MLPLELLHDYENIQEIHKGRFSLMYKARNRRQEIVAIKLFHVRNQEQSREFFYQFLREMYTHINTMRHEHIVEVYEQIHEVHDNVVQSKPCGFAMEYMEHSLHLLIAEFCHPIYEDDEEEYKKSKRDRYKSWIYQIASALNHIHTQGFIHRDVTALSVFTNDGCLVKVGKMEKSRDYNILMTANVGEAGYIAPEIANAVGEKAHYTTKCDSFSLFVLALKMFHAQIPEMTEDSVNNYVKGIQQGTEVAIEEALWPLFLRNLSHNAEDRDDMASVMASLEQVGVLHYNELEDM